MKKIFCLFTFLFIVIHLFAAEKNANSILNKGNVSVLIKNDIISKTESKSTEKISLFDSLKFIEKMTSLEDSNDDYNLKQWYGYEKFAPYDKKFNDDEKTLLMKFMNSRTSLISTVDLEKLNLSDNITLFQTIKFGVLLIADSAGCFNAYDEYFYETKDQFYTQALNKNLIKSKDNIDDNAPVSKKDFYDFMSQIFVKNFKTGSAAGTSESNYQEMMKQLKKIKKEKQRTIKKEQKLEKQYFKANPVFSEDLTFNLNPIDEMFFDDTRPGYAPLLHWETPEGKWIGKSLNGYGEIREEIISLLLKCNERKISHLNIKTFYNNKSYYYENIKLPEIKIVEDLSAPIPGTYYHKKNQWPIQSLTLKEGVFNKNSIYFLYSKDHSYRREEYNKSEVVVLRNGHPEGDVYQLDEYAGTTGTNYMEEIHIRELQIEKNKEGTYIFHMSPISKEIFKVVPID